MSKIVNNSENIEDIINEVDSFEPVILLRLGLVRFMENLSFDEIYLKNVQIYKRNKKQIDFFNLCKTTRNSNKNK